MEKHQFDVIHLLMQMFAERTCEEPGLAFFAGSHLAHLAQLGFHSIPVSASIDTFRPVIEMWTSLSPQIPRCSKWPQKIRSGTFTTRSAWSAGRTPILPPLTGGSSRTSSNWADLCWAWSSPTSPPGATPARPLCPGSPPSATPAGSSCGDHQGSPSDRPHSSGGVYLLLSFNCKYKYFLCTVAPVRPFMSSVKQSLCLLPSLFPGHLMGLLWSPTSHPTPSLKLNMELLSGTVQFISPALLLPTTLPSLINAWQQERIVYWTVTQEYSHHKQRTKTSLWRLRMPSKKRDGKSWLQYHSRGKR